MRFVLIDRIQEIVPGQSLTAVKNLSLAEEYLADHFPGFPVMPGVLMLEAMTQSAAWLVRSTEDFKQQFLNNHISTILEDFDGENVVSEFSLTRRTN